MKPIKIKPIRIKESYYGSFRNYTLYVNGYYKGEYATCEIAYNEGIYQLQGVTPYDEYENTGRSDKPNQLRPNPH